jgi:urease accessory protein UreH
MGTQPTAGQGLLTPPAARITRADLPPPPELLDRDPAAAPCEHVGGLRAELRLRDGRVCLGRTYQQNPLRILRPVAERPGAPALLYLLNSTAGLLDGDGQWVDLDAGPGVRCFVTNQSAGRVHPCPLWHAAARLDLRVAPGATLCLLPGPTIPFAGSRYHQTATIHLEAGAQVVWGDILLPGRTRYAKAPERFVFERLVQELRVHREGRLVHHERLAWSGPWGEDVIRWHFGDAEAAASLFISGALSDDALPELAEGEVAVQATAAGDTCVRLVARDAERLIAAAARLALTAAALAAGDPAPWLLGSSHLAANHWFSPVPES